jgi:hypothetical protein
MYLFNRDKYEAQVMVSRVNSTLKVVDMLYFRQRPSLFAPEKHQCHLGGSQNILQI